MANPGFSKNYTADAVMVKRRLAIYGAADGTVNMASLATQLLVGVVELGCTDIGDRVDIIKEGTALIEFGGAVTRGAALTADAQGRAVVAAPGAGVNNHIIGFAEISGVLGDIGEVWISRGIMQG